MAILKCKMCGGDLNITEGVSVCECEYCGTKQTVPTADNEKKLNLFNRATRLRINGEFDKAAALYESLVAEFPEEAEAYWGLVICHYGIEYVDDPATGNRIPTCHRASFDPLSADENFRLAMEYADVMAQKVYRDEAREIDRIREEILAVCKDEKPYDIFICYKETDAKGERTIDSVIAQNVYDALTDKGYRVFFSRISLEDKLGSQYEPFIFAALNSAKVMLAFGTKYEYFHAVWVKNEWSRFLKLMAKDKKRVLIPCYKDMDAYDMPDEFHALQAQDMGKVGALQDLMRGIEKIIAADKPSPIASHVPTQGAAQAAVTQLMLAGDVMYEGEVFANIPHGYGKASYANGDRYEGQWNRGKRHGQGKMIWAKGGEWNGEFQNDLPWNGGDIYRYDNGSYEGKLVNGVKCGQGKFLWDNGNCYEGEWQNDQYHGQGKITWGDGNHCSGEFREGDLWSGSGIYHYDNGTYEGEMVGGNRHGKGKITWENGSVWSGEFRNDKPTTGFGVIYYDDGYYVGPLVNGVKQGTGKYIWNDGDCYEGEWQNDLRHGKGKMMWRAGGIWSGEFRDDNYWNGSGDMYFTDGTGCHVITKRGVHR